MFILNSGILYIFVSFKIHSYFESTYSYIAIENKSNKIKQNIERNTFFFKLDKVNK